MKLLEYIRENWLIIVPLAAGVAFLVYKLVLPKLENLDNQVLVHSQSKTTQLEEKTIERKKSEGNVVNTEYQQIPQVQTIRGSNASPAFYTAVY